MIMNQIPSAPSPEKTVDLILNPCTIRRTCVLDIFGDRIVLSNQRKALSSLNLLHPAILTYLPPQMPLVRYGFDIMVTSISDDYAFAEKKIPAVMVLQISSARKMDLRVFPRIKIDGLSLFLRDEELDIMDISAGGAHLIRKKKLHENVKVGTTIPLSLKRSRDVITRDAKILRLWNVRGINGSEHLAVKFLQPVDF
jgi:hypothetical protein